MPIDTRGVGTVEQHCSASLGEIIPNPIHESLDFDPQTAQQSDMSAEPHAVGSHAFKLVAMLADLGYCGIPANHRHDPFIMVVKWGTWSAFNIGRSHLIEERLKLMVIILVHERNMDLVI